MNEKKTNESGVCGDAQVCWEAPPKPLQLWLRGAASLWPSQRHPDLLDDDDGGGNSLSPDESTRSKNRAGGDLRLSQAAELAIRVEAEEEEEDSSEDDDDAKIRSFCSAFLRCRCCCLPSKRQVKASSSFFLRRRKSSFKWSMLVVVGIEWRPSTWTARKSPPPPL